jgi:hypothetical protein
MNGEDRDCAWCGKRVHLHYFPQCEHGLTVCDFCPIENVCDDCKDMNT